MTSLPVDRELKQLATTNCSFGAELLPMDNSSEPFPSVRAPESADAGVTKSSGPWCEYIQQMTSLEMYQATRLSAQKTNNKGKGIQRQHFDWDMITHDSSESEREGKSLLSAYCASRNNAGIRIELAYRLLASLPRSRLATVQRRIVPLLQFDLVGSLPPELALQILVLLPAAALLNCTLVCRRWNLLANDQTLWRNLCHTRGWEWRSKLISPPPRQSEAVLHPSTSDTTREDRDEDEGMGDEEEGEDEGSVADGGGVIHVPDGYMGLDQEFMSMNLSLQDHDFQNLIGQFVPLSLPTASMPISRSSSGATTMIRTISLRHVPLSSSRAGMTLTTNYKLLHQTHTLLRRRVRHSAYRLRTLPGAEGGGHTAAVYCLALWSYDTAHEPVQVLFTGSKDRTVREWDLNTNKVRRRVVGMHASSVLSLCVTATAVGMFEDGAPAPGSADTKEGCQSSEAGILVSGGSDCRVVVWDLAKFRLIKVLRDHQDSVLCVRTDNGRLVSCSKDRTIRTYAFPWLKPELVLQGHRAAVNAVSIAGDVIVSGSGDRSVRVWDARTGALISNFEDHHARAISSVELSPPFILSGSSDRHVRMFDMRTKRGWSTCPEFDNPIAGQPLNPLVVAQESLGGDMPALGSPFFLHSSLSLSLQQARQDVHVPDGATKICSACGTRVASTGTVRGPEKHSHPVRSVAVGDEFAVSGSYDCTVKVWDRATGALVADLTGGHTGRIFCVAQDSTKIVSCGEDQRICIWDFSHGIDTSFVKL